MCAASDVGFGVGHPKAGAGVEAGVGACPDAFWARQRCQRRRLRRFGGWGPVGVACWHWGVSGERGAYWGPSPSSLPLSPSSSPTPSSSAVTSSSRGVLARGGGKVVMVVVVAEGGCADEKLVSQRRGSDLVNETWGGSFSDRENHIGVGYTVFEVVGWSNWARRKGGASWNQNPKPSRRGSVLANETWGGSFSGREDHIGVGYTGFEVVGWCDWVRRKGGASWSQNPKPSHWGSVLGAPL